MINQSVISAHVINSKENFAGSSQYEVNII